MHTYRLVNLTRRNAGERMYIYGDTASTTEQARKAQGRLCRSEGDVLAIERSEWPPGSGTPSTVIVDMEDRPGQWSVGT